MSTEGPGILVLVGSQETGPFSRMDLEAQIENGLIDPTLLAWHEGLPEWIPLEDILATPATAAPPPAEATSSLPPPEPQSDVNAPASPVRIRIATKPQATLATEGDVACSDDSFDPSPTAIPTSRFKGTSGSQSATFPTRDDRSFSSYLGSAWLYPFRGDGWIVMLAGTFVFGILNVGATFAPLIGMLLAAVAGGLYFAMLQAIIQTTAHGEDHPPDWPDLSEWYSDVIFPYLRWLFIGFVCFGPGAILFTVGIGSENPAVWLTGAALGVLGMIIFPMAVLSVALQDSVVGLHPAIIFPSMVRTPGTYIVVVIVSLVLFGLLMGIRWFTDDIPIASFFLAEMFGLYIGFVWARILGGYYRTQTAQLGWF